MSRSNEKKKKKKKKTSSRQMGISKPGISSLNRAFVTHLKCLNTPCNFFHIFYEGYKFCNFLFAFLYTNSLRKMAYALKVKNLNPVGANYSLL